MQNKHPEKCVNCGEGIWLGAFFDGFFLCSNCDARKGEIIFKLKARLTKRALDGRKRGAKSKSLNGKGGSKAARQ